jgi:hypothetical protein
MNQTCLNCGDTFVGRSDKKFCCDQCRNTYNNRNRSLHEQHIIDINKILRSNRKILKQFNPEGKTTIRRKYLEQWGFNFKYHTHTFTTKHNNTYKFCYEYGYLVLDDEKVLIVNEQKYMP